MFEFILIESVSTIHDTIFIKIERKLKKINFSLLRDIFLFFCIPLNANVYLVFFITSIFFFFSKSKIKQRLEDEKRMGMSINYLINQILIKFN